MCARICLGTAQLGMDYEIFPKYGKPSKKDTFEILDTALQNGIEYIDTAQAYGNAEELLGEYGINRYKINVITKVMPNTFKNNRPPKHRELINMTKKSLDKMKIDKLYGLLLHTPNDLYNRKLIEQLVELKDEGLVDGIGVSVYHSIDACNALEKDVIDIIQMPYSVFDQRAKQEYILSSANIPGIEMHIRSIFLKGILTRSPYEMPYEIIKPINSDLIRFEKIIEKYGFSKQEACFLFALTNPDIDVAVFGVHTKKQLLENIEMSKLKTGFGFCRRELIKTFGNRARMIPSLWANPEGVAK